MTVAEAIEILNNIEDKSKELQYMDNEFGLCAIRRILEDNVGVIIE